MLNALTRSRSPEFHLQTMLKLIIIALLLVVVWEPIRPVRNVTADILVHTADFVRR